MLSSLRFTVLGRLWELLSSKLEEISSKLDQFYTKPEVVDECLRVLSSVVDLSTYTLVEPSAGTGSFYIKMKALSDNVLGYDLDPKCSGVVERDFLQVNTDEIRGGKVYIGNPPFGKNSSLALKFLNKCGEDGEYVAMILPKTFSKILYQDKVNKNLGLLYEMVVPKDSFIYNDAPYDVPCVFQVWGKLEHQRGDVDVGVMWIEECSADVAEYSIRRVGGRSGSVLEGVDYSPATTYFVRDLVKGAKQKIHNQYANIKEEASKTVGVRSITLREISYIMNKVA